MLIAIAAWRFQVRVSSESDAVFTMRLASNCPHARVQIYSSMNAQRPDLQQELQNFLVRPGLEGGAKLDPLHHSVVADLRQHPAFFLTHVYCQVLPILATFMNRYGPNLCVCTRALCCFFLS